MKNYYSENLNASKLHDVYQTEIGRVNEYLNKEIEYVQNHLSSEHMVLEMGAGYGRIMKRLSTSAAFVYGIDISENTVAFGQEYLKNNPNCRLSVADAYRYETEMKFDTVLCLQNGLAAMKGDAGKLIEIAVKLLKKDGKAIFSSYSPKFWDVRLAWFQEQADKGLLGKIDYDKTKDGTIVCKDGFIGTTFSLREMEELGRASGCGYKTEEVGASSIFLVIGSV